jgi:16S rRNA (cytosine967-C5)-methyltransferase
MKKRGARSTRQARPTAARAAARPERAKRVEGAALKSAGAPTRPAASPSATGGGRVFPGLLSARALAITTLARVEATQAYLNVVLDAALDENPLADPRDAGLVTEVCYGATRRRLLLDAAILQVADRKLDALEDKVLAALRIGAYQLFFTRVPKHAAVADTVEALKQAGVERAAGFVNAILRRISEMPAPPTAAGDVAAKLALEHSHPEWLVRRWLRHFGEERAVEMLAADNSAPSVVVRVNAAKTTRAELLTLWDESGIEATPTTVSPQGLVLESPGRVDQLLGYSEGLFAVQDEAAQLVGLYAAVPAGAKVLDVCAAPGGKALHLAETNTVVACDLHANKLRLIQAEASRLGLEANITTRACDASKPLPGDLGEFDVVMVDAPCSGLGTLRRHPELRYRRKEEDIAALAKLQRSIIENAQVLVKPGGLLIYAVCSPEPQEGADQAELFLRSHPDFTAEPPSLGYAVPNLQGHLRTLPGKEGMDGFFAARLRRMY